MKLNAFLTTLGNLSKPVTQNDFPTPAFEGLVPTLSVAVGTLISLLISFFIISYFFYFPIKKIVKEREAKIAEELISASKMNSNSSQILRRAEEGIETAKQEAEEIVNSAKTEASNLRFQSQVSLKMKTELLLRQTEDAIANEYSAAKEKIKQEIVDTSLILVEKLLEKEVDQDTNRSLISEMLTNLEAKDLTTARDLKATKKVNSKQKPKK